MDKQYIINFNLMEASAHLEELKKKLEKYKNIDDYNLIDWQVNMEHIMAHLNKAYNVRKLPYERLVNLSDEDKQNLSQTPKNLLYLIS